MRAQLYELRGAVAEVEAIRIRVEVAITQTHADMLGDGRIDAADQFPGEAAALTGNTAGRCNDHVFVSLGPTDTATGVELHTVRRSEFSKRVGHRRKAGDAAIKPRAARDRALWGIDPLGVHALIIDIAFQPERPEVIAGLAADDPAQPVMDGIA